MTTEQPVVQTKDKRTNADVATNQPNSTQKGSTHGGAKVVTRETFLPRACLSVPVCQRHLTGPCVCSGGKLRGFRIGIARLMECNARNTLAKKGNGPLD